MDSGQWERTKEIFGEALALSPEDRRQFVIEAVAGDNEVRREVEKLLGWFDSRFMENPAVSEVADQIIEKDQFSPGQTFSHYRVRKKLGAGGMGVVYQAVDTKLDRNVAVKFLNERFSKDHEKLNRFVQEAKATSTLNHPHIVTVHEIDEFEGTHYIAAEYIDGETLRELLSRRDEPISLERVLKIAIEVAEALSAAHQAGIVHRDIKPENIMVRKDGYVKVLDFGLAKLTAIAPPSNVSFEAGPSALVMTDPGMVMGTASYMSPEQARGIEADERTDIWSLGVVLYEMLAGRMPFEGETVSHTIVAIFDTTPERLYNVPDELQRIVTKALAKKPAERYRTAKDLSNDLTNLKRELDFQGELDRSLAPDRSLLVGEINSAARSTESTEQTQTGESVGIRVTNESRLIKVARQAGRHKIVTVSLGMTLAVAVFASLYVVSLLGTTREIASIAVMPFKNESGIRDIEYLTDGMTETLISSLSTIPNLNVKSRSSVFRYKGAEFDLKKIAADLRVEAVLTGRITNRDDQLTLNLELIDARTLDVLWGSKYESKSSELASLQAEITRDVAQKLRSRLTGAERQRVTREYTANAEAYRLYLKGQFYWNKHRGEDFKRAVEYFKQALDEDPEYAHAYAGMALSYVLFSEFGVESSPKESLPLARAAALKAIEIDPSLAEPHTALGLYHRFYSWNLEAADKELRKAIELNPNYATAHQWLSLNLAFQGRFDESIKEMERAGEIDPLSRIIREERGYVLFLARRYDEAIAHIKDTQALLGEVQSGWSLGRIYLAKGMYKEAIAEIRKSKEMGNGPSGMLVCALARSGQRKEALKMLGALESKWEAQPEWQTQAERAAVYTALGDKDMAFYWLGRMIDTRSNVTRVMASPEMDDLRNDPRFEEFRRLIALARQLDLS